jgi:hypothetical protein
VPIPTFPPLKEAMESESSSKIRLPVPAGDMVNPARAVILAPRSRREYPSASISDVHGVCDPPPQPTQELTVSTPLIMVLPTTCNAAVGDVVPIPTLPKTPSVAPDARFCVPV